MRRLARTTVVALCLAVCGLRGAAGAEPLPLRQTGSGIVEVDTVDDVTILIARGYRPLGVRELEAWRQRRRDDARASDATQRAAETRGAVYLVAALVVLYVVAIILLVRWVKRRNRRAQKRAISSS